MIRITIAMLVAATAAADDKIVGYWIGDHHLDELQTGQYVDPLDYGFTDLLVSSYNVPESIGPTKVALYRAWSDWVGARGRIWIIMQWQGHCCCSAQLPDHPSYDPQNGTARDFFGWQGNEEYRPYVDADGREYKRMVCPTWNKWWEWQTARIRRLTLMLRPLDNVRGIGLDMEHYLADAPSYPSGCHCRFCAMVPDQYEHIRQLATRLRQAAGDVDIVIINGNGLEAGGGPTPKPVPIYLAMAHALEPYMLMEDTYVRGWQDTDDTPGGLGYYRYGYAYHQSVWTDNGTYNVRLVPGVYPNRLYAVSDDRRRRDPLPGVHDVFADTVWACHEHSSGGVWAYLPPHAIPLDYDFCPGDCCCRGRDCAGRAVDVCSYFEAFRRESPSNACRYRTLPNGMYEQEVIDIDGSLVRRMVAEHRPCAPAWSTGNDTCDRN